MEKINGISVEIAPESDTPRLREYLSHIERYGAAKTWEDLLDLEITEKDFEEGPCYLGVDNSGTLKVFLESRIPWDYYNEEYSWCRRLGLGAAHFDYSGCPEWLRRKFEQFWHGYGCAAKAYYAARDGSDSKFAGFVD